MYSGCYGRDIECYIGPLNLSIVRLFRLKLKGRVVSITIGARVVLRLSHIYIITATRESYIQDTTRDLIS